MPAECKVTMRAHYNAYVGISICTLPCIYIYSNHNIIRRNKNISFTLISISYIARPGRKAIQ